jgi:hypothetical protein
MPGALPLALAENIQNHCSCNERKSVLPAIFIIIVTALLPPTCTYKTFHERVLSHDASHDIQSFDASPLLLLGASTPQHSPRWCRAI